MWCRRNNYFMACTVHERRQVFEMSYTHLRCSRPCIATCFAHSGAVRPPSFTWRVCGFSESHDLECAHDPAQVAVSKGELVCYRSQFPTGGGLGRGAEEVVSPWPAPRAEVEFYEPCCRLTAIQKACVKHTAEQCALLRCRKPWCLCALTVSTGQHA